MFYIFNNLYNKIFYKNFIYKKEAGKNIERRIKLKLEKAIEILKKELEYTKKCEELRMFCKCRIYRI